MKKEELTPAKRLAIYRRALQIIENEPESRYLINGLCWLFKMIQFDLFKQPSDYFYDNRPQEFDAFFETDEKNYFQEEINDRFRGVRRVIVELMIAELEFNLQNK